MSERRHAWLLAMLIICAATAFAGEPTGEQSIPVTAPSLAHGHLVDIPYMIDGEGAIYWSRDYAFLAMKLDSIPAAPAAIEYTQRVGFLRTRQYDLPSGGIIARSIPSTEVSEDGWLLLPLSKPCAPGATEAFVGLVSVCPPRDYATGTLVHACESLTSGVLPIYQDVPAEAVKCGSSKRRAAGR